MYKFNHGRNFVIVTPSAVQTQIRRMKTGKALWHDGVQIEHLVYATPLLIQYLSLLFQFFVISQNYISAALSEGLVTCVLKKGKNPKVGESHRPITIWSTIGKFFEKLIFEEIKHEVRP